MNATSLTPMQRGEIDAASLDTGPSLSAFGSSKILHRHLERLAIVYVRQSDPQQVLQHVNRKNCNTIWPTVRWRWVGRANAYW